MPNNGMLDVKKILVGLVLIFAVGFVVMVASAAPATPAPAAQVEEPGFLDRLRAKLPDNPFGMSDEERLEIVREYNAETARQGQALRVANAAAQRNAAAALAAKQSHERTLRALKTCIGTAMAQ